MATANYTDALAFLQKLDVADKGSSVYEHLTRVLVKVLEERPSQAVDLLETSLLVKKTAFEAKESSPLVPISSAPDAARAVAVSSLFGLPDLPIDENGEPVEAEAPNDYECEDMAAHIDLFDALGVGLGRSEMYNIMLATKKLGEDPKRGVKTVRFFGKFFGLYADYYVFETTLNDTPEVPEAPEGVVPPEAAGAGANNYTYFVCNYLGGPMTQLPYVTPDQIKVARQIKKFLTGRLTSHVSTYPLFPGNEANFLRAQIARIACSTVCCPSGLFTAGEDGSLEKAEEWEPQPGREMAQLPNWVHRYPHLKKQGRCEVFKRELPEDANEDEFYNEDEKEEGPEPLASVEGDKLPGKDGEDAEGPALWTSLVSNSSENVKFQVGGIRSTLWPGAYCAAKDKNFANVYVGWGVKYAPFVPLPPPPVAKEYDQALVESLELPPKPAPPPPEGEEGEAEE